MKNKSAAFFLLQLFLMVSIGAQDQTNASIDNFEVGIYASFEEFKNNTPSVKLNYKASADSDPKRVLIYLQRNQVWYYDQSKNDYFRHTGDCWGYCDGKKFLIKHNTKFFPLKTMPLYSTFATDRKKTFSTETERVKTDKPNVVMLGGTLRIRSYEDLKATACETYALDMTSGEKIKLTDRKLSGIISNDAELLQDFKQNSYRKFLYEQYITEYNARNHSK